MVQESNVLPRVVAAALAVVASLAANVVSANPLVWHVESAAGEVLSSHGADRALNPASVIKLAVTLRALERLGPDHRFVTRFATDGTLDPESGVLHGDLVVIGGADPDFHPENAFMIAGALSAAGVRRVEGALRISGDFWIGWEGGSERRPDSAEARARRMASRLREAWDPARWRAATREIWQQYASRGGEPRTGPARIEIAGGTGSHDGPVPARLLASHHSNPLPRILKRLNAYSNNDIERLEASIGPPAELQRYLAERLDVPADAVRVATLSGLGTNRLTPRDVVRLLRELRETAGRLGLDAADVMPAGGCDPGTLERYPRFNEGERGERALVGKTGTLVTTDGGVSVLAGFLSTAGGEQVLCVAYPESGHGVRAARRTLERWLLQRLDGAGGGKPRACPAPVVHSDFEAVANTAIASGDPVTAPR